MITQSLEPAEVDGLFAAGAEGGVQTAVLVQPSHH
jgi:hypothetical protein